jgi:hypothetical protein
MKGKDLIKLIDPEAEYVVNIGEDTYCGDIVLKPIPVEKEGRWYLYAHAEKQLDVVAIDFVHSIYK